MILRARTDLSIATIAVTTNLAAAAGAASGLFAQEPYGSLEGLFFGGGLRLLGVQALGVLAVFVWVFSTCYGLFLILKKTVGLRVKPEEEIRGLDIGEHGIESYSGFQVFTTQ